MKIRRFGTLASLGLVAIGCTSLLGDFEVAPDSASSGVCPAEQTKCVDQCVDTKSNAAHCGACNRACPEGLSCVGGNCACPDNGAFCDGRCFARTDRQHCGVTCSACIGDQVCDGTCVAPPPPAFDKVPRSATGWIGVGNEPLSLTIKGTGQPGTKYECRTGPVGTFSDTVPAWANCDGATGDGTVHRPTESPDSPEGSYRTEYRYKLLAFTSPVVHAQYYVHKSLNGVATCPRPGVPIDGPHFTDQQYFAAAQAWAAANAAAFPTATTFPAGGEKRDDAIYLGNPWIKVPFVGVTHTLAMNGSENFDPWPPANSAYLFNERSLRHRWVLNDARTMMMVLRQYIHPKTNDCKQRYEVGSDIHKNLGPPGRGVRMLDCEAYVLNTKGNAICLNASASGVEPEVVPVDSRIGVMAGTALGGPVSVSTNSTYVSSASEVFRPDMANGFLQLGVGLGGRWYQIATYSSPRAVFISEGYVGPNQMNQNARFVDKAQAFFVIGSGFAKLHQDAHGWAAGTKKIGGVQIPAPRPSHRTKCETAGCDIGKPWLTYLPP